MEVITIENILKAHHRLAGVAAHTPLQRNAYLSERYNCNVFLKREDLQAVRSYKIRGAYNFLRTLPDGAASAGIVCASAGNHAQAVAYCCNLLGIQAQIFMPATTPKQKVSRVDRLGRNKVHVVMHGDTYDEAYAEAWAQCRKDGRIFVHPFDDPRVIEGQGTVAVEILADMREPADFIFLPVGGGGLASGMGTYLKALSPQTRLIGVEPAGAASMKASLERGEVVSLETMNKFVDGAAVGRVGELTFRVCREVLETIAVVPEGKVCTTILELYQEEAVVAEPAGALSVSALDEWSDRLSGANVVCVLSGGNNDIDRMQEIKERSLIYEGLKHYFFIRFPQRAGALKDFVHKVLGPEDDITRFEYVKKNNREEGPALLGVELRKREDYSRLVSNMEHHGIRYTPLNADPDLFNYFI